MCQQLLNAATSPPNLQIKYSASSQKENDLREWEFSQLCIFAARTEYCSSSPLEVVYAHKSPATTMPSVRRKFPSHLSDTRRRNRDCTMHAEI